MQNSKLPVGFQSKDRPWPTIAVVARQPLDRPIYLNNNQSESSISFKLQAFLRRSGYASVAAILKAGLCRRLVVKNLGGIWICISVPVKMAARLVSTECFCKGRPELKATTKSVFEVLDPRLSCFTQVFFFLLLKPEVWVCWDSWSDSAPVVTEYSDAELVSILSSDFHLEAPEKMGPIIVVLNKNRGQYLNDHPNQVNYSTTAIYWPHTFSLLNDN